MAPVAGRITNTEENRNVLPTCLQKNFLLPRTPFHRIVSMLKKIGRLFINQLISSEICFAILCFHLTSPFLKIEFPFHEKVMHSSLSRKIHSHYRARPNTQWVAGVKEPFRKASVGTGSSAIEKNKGQKTNNRPITIFRKK